MENVLLVEDRLERMAYICKKKGLNLNEFKHLKIFTNDEFERLKESLQDAKFDVLNNYKIVITHQSAWSQVVLSQLRVYCKKENKPLIIFSGSVNTSHLHLSNPPILIQDVDKFYSNRLLLFLDEYFKNGNINMLLLQYGDKWRLSLLLEARNNLSVFLSKNKGIQSLDYYADEVGIPEVLFSMTKEFDLNLDWYELGIRENAENVLKDLKNTLSTIIKREVYDL